MDLDNLFSKELSGSKEPVSPLRQKVLPFSVKTHINF